MQRGITRTLCSEGGRFIEFSQAGHSHSCHSRTNLGALSLGPRQCVAHVQVPCITEGSAGFAHRGVKRLRVEAECGPDINRREEGDGEESSANTQSGGKEWQAAPENVEELLHESDSEEFGFVISWSRGGG